MQNELSKIDLLLSKVKKLTQKNKKKTAFIFGNTSKSNNVDFYVTPIREFNTVIIFGAIIYDINTAKKIAKKIDGLVNYVFVDSEKKIKKKDIKKHFPNIERSIKENIKKSIFLTYKGNDLTVESVDLFLSNNYKDDVKGLGSKKIAILGAGNLGFKIALKLVERGSRVVINRRNLEKLKILSQAINFVKPVSTIERVSFTKDVYKASKNADVIIGATNGVPIIDRKILEIASKNVIVIDVGKGTINDEAINYALKKNIILYRLDVTAALAGVVESNLYYVNVYKKTIGKKIINGEKIVSGGLLAEKNDIIVDNIHSPKKIIGISNGKGDIESFVTKSDHNRIEKIRKFLNISI